MFPLFPAYPPGIRLLPMATEGWTCRSITIDSGRKSDYPMIRCAFPALTASHSSFIVPTILKIIKIAKVTVKLSNFREISNFSFCFFFLFLAKEDHKRQSNYTRAFFNKNLILEYRDTFNYLLDKRIISSSTNKYITSTYGFNEVISKLARTTRIPSYVNISWNTPTYTWFILSPNYSNFTLLELFYSNYSKYSVH